MEIEERARTGWEERGAFPEGARVPYALGKGGGAMGARGIGWLSLLLACLLAPGMAMGEDGNTGGHEEKRSGYHELGLFVGATSKNHEGETETTLSLGIDYLYVAVPRFEIGVMLDYAGEDFRSYLIAFPLALNPIGKWVVYLAPGLEHVNHESEFLIRLGILYAFEIGGEFFLAPQLNWDRTEEDAFVYGVSLGRAFGK